MSDDGQLRVGEPARTAWRSRLREWLAVADLELTFAVLLLVVLTLAFITLAGEVEAKPFSIDERILLALREPGNPSEPIGGHALTTMMRDVTALGSGTVMGLFSVAFVGYLLLTHRPGAALLVVAAVLGGWLLNDTLKQVFDRPRPTIVPHLMSASNLGFPSGHSTIAAVFYPTIAGLTGRLVEKRRLRFYLMTLAILGSLLIGFSRVYLGVHYPSDVLGGLAVGFAWALACGIVARVLQRGRVIDD